MPIKDKEKKRAYARAYRKKNPKKHSEYDARYRNSAKGKAAERQYQSKNRKALNARGAEWKRGHAEQCKADRIRKEYGISYKEYLRLKQQATHCPICHCELNEDVPKNKQNRVLDHCHKTGAVRGFVCLQCNIGLGSFGDDPEIVARALQWLRNGTLVVDEPLPLFRGLDGEVT